jgi:hypothetical protein
MECFCEKIPKRTHVGSRSMLSRRYPQGIRGDVRLSNNVGEASKCFLMVILRRGEFHCINIVIEVERKEA